MSISPGANDHLGSPPMQSNGLPLKSKIKAKKSLFFKQSKLNKSNNAVGIAENNGSYMQKSAAIDEKDFEEDEEEKRDDHSNECSPDLRNKIIMVEDIGPKKPVRSTISGTVYFKFSEEQIEKYHMNLKGSDLYCYDFETKKQIKFMHSLVGCFLISPTKTCENSSHDVNESINGVIYRRIELKLSQLFKRVFFVESESEYEGWTTNIEKVINPQRLNEFYVKDDLLGQGSFGKVYKGRSKATNEIVAIKYIDKKAMKPHEVSL
jgi:hypothetical protein